MPKVGEIPRSGHERLDLPGLPWLQEALQGGVVRDGIYRERCTKLAEHLGTGTWLPDRWKLADAARTATMSARSPG